MFVFFGGDTQDKGIGDIRFTRLLLALKQEHPDRVQLIIGNCDANKLLQHTTPDAVSEEDVVESYRSTRNEVDPKSEADKSPTHDNFMLNYLQQGKLAYVFGSTLFVHGGISESNVGTVPGKRERVNDVHEWVRELNSWAAQELTNLAAAQELTNLAAAQELTNLAAAQELTNLAAAQELTNLAAAQELTQELTSLAAQELTSLAADPYSGSNLRDRKGGGLSGAIASRLMDYRVPGGNGGASAIYEHFLSNGNATQLLPLRVREYLVASGITGFLDFTTRLYY
jgi:hypothetical protein